MAIPTVIGVGALATGVAPQTVALPASGLVANDILILQVASSVPAQPVSILNAAGGTWTAIGSAHSNEGVRGSWFWSRYNGSQTAPGLNDSLNVQHARIVAVRGCITTGSPIHAQDGSGPLFAQTSSTLPTLTTTSNDCLILDCIVGDGPDADGTGVFGSWTNAALSPFSEVFDDSSAAGVGGSLAMQSGGLHIGGVTGTTTVAHASIRVALKKIALTPAVVSVIKFDRNQRGQPVINGVTRFMRGIYDADLPQFADWVGFVATRNYARYNLDFVIHPQAGTFGNALKFANALQPLGMFHWVTGNFFGNFTIAPEDFIPATSGYDVYNNTSYTIPPAANAPFRDQWIAHAASAGLYHADEPEYQPRGWYHTDNSAGHWSTENYGTEKVLNGTFATDLASWTNDGSVQATWDASGRASMPTGARLRQTMTVSPVVELSDAYRLICTLTAAGGGARPICTVVSNGVTIYDSSVNPTSSDAKETFPRPTGTTLEIVVQAVTGAGFLDTVSLFAVGGDPPPVPLTRSRDDMVMLHTYAKSVMPDMPTIGTFLNDNITQWRDWSPFDIADWLGCDIYTIGLSPEIHPDNGLNTSTYGYMNFSVAEAAAIARYYAPLYGRVPHIVLQANKFGGTSRYITLSEMLSHLIIAVAELRGIGATIWWAMGTQAGALDERPFQVYSPNGVQTVFACPSAFVEEVVDVEVKVNNVIQSPSSYTVQNVLPVESTSIVRSGNFWVFENPATVTMLTPPVAGTNTLVVTVNRWPQTRRNATKDLLDSMTALLASLESVLIQPPNPALLTSNSTGQANFLAWRIPYCNTLRSQSADKPVWLFGAILRYQAEYDDLNLASPTYTSSVHMMDGQAQFGNVRTTCWESGSGLVAAYNLHPDAQVNVTLQWHVTINRVQVLGENRDVPVNGDGRSWTDTFGGASSLRQGAFNQGHLYQLTLAGTTGPTAGGVSLTGAQPGRVLGTILKPGSMIS